MSLLLGIDVGTASTKGVLVRSDGSVVARAQVAHQTANPRPGWFEHDAEAVWWSDFLQVSGELMAVADARPAALGVSGIGPCLLPAGERAAPLRPAILYGIDTRASAEIAELDAELGADRIVARCGSPLTSQAVGPKMLWLRRHEPAVWDRTRRFFMASSFLVHRLTGAYVLDHHSASQCTPLYDAAEHAWIPEWWARIAPEVEPPELRWSEEVVGTVSEAAADATGLPAGLPVTAGTVDAWAEAESVGVRSPGDVMVMYGSTMFLVGLLSEPRPSASLWGTAGVRPGVACVAAGMATSGSLTGWLADLFQAGFGALTEEAAAVPAGSEGLLMLPYFAGERTPLFDDRARGLLLGMTLGHGRGHLYRAALEAVACGVRHNLEAMREAAAPIERLVAVGGGTAGGLWTQVVSDVTGLAQDVCRESVGASYGDAMLAASAGGVVPAAEVAAWNEVVDRIEPREQERAGYDELYGLYRDAYRDNARTMHRLADRGDRR